MELILSGFLYISSVPASSYSAQADTHRCESYQQRMLPRKIVSLDRKTLNPNHVFRSGNHQNGHGQTRQFQRVDLRLLDHQGE